MDNITSITTTTNSTEKPYSENNIKSYKGLLMFKVFLLRFLWFPHHLSQMPLCEETENCLSEISVTILFVTSQHYRSFMYTMKH